MYGPVIDELIDALRCLPSVGPKSAQRMALHLLERDRPAAKRLAQALNESADTIKHCDTCRTLTESTTCAICQDSRRDSALLCVVETPADMFAIEQSGSFKGRYFVLMGHLSPIDGVGPDDIGIDQLEDIMASKQITEIILATNLTVEGEATAFYISQMAKEHSIETSRIAQGVPLGSELEYVDGGTLGHAFNSRKPV